MSQVKKLYIVVDNSLSPGLAAAQVAHVATVAANKWKIDKSTYIIVLKAPVRFPDDDEPIWDLFSRITHECELYGHKDHDHGFLGRKPVDDIVYFNEPDLDGLMTALAVPDPPEDTFSTLELWKGGVEHE